MSRRQTRRSIDIDDATYIRLVTFCEAHNVSMASVAEHALRPTLGLEAAPMRRCRPATRQQREAAASAKKR